MKRLDVFHLGTIFANPPRFGLIGGLDQSKVLTARLQGTPAIILSVHSGIQEEPLDQLGILIIGIVLQSLSAVVIAGSVVVGILQLRALRDQARAAIGQLETSRQQLRTQNLMTVIEWLQEPAVRQARSIVIGRLSKKHGGWTPEEREAAALVCSSYDIAALLIDADLIEADPLIQNWAPSIRKCWSALTSYVQESRATAGPDRYLNFERLFVRTQAIGMDT